MWLRKKYMFLLYLWYASATYLWLCRLLTNPLRRTLLKKI